MSLGGGEQPSTLSPDRPTERVSVLITVDLAKVQKSNRNLQTNWLLFNDTFISKMISIALLLYPGLGLALPQVGFQTNKFLHLQGFKFPTSILTDQHANHSRLSHTHHQSHFKSTLFTCGFERNQ